MANYSKGSISIPNVTGNIVINITAVQSVEPLVNLVDLYGVKPNTRISASDGSDRSQNGFCAVGSVLGASHLIPVQQNDVIRIKGGSLPASVDNLSVIASFKDGTFYTADYLTCPITEPGKFNISYDKNTGVTSITLLRTSEAANGIRLSFICSDATNLIITKNQEIPA